MNDAAATDTKGNMVYSSSAGVEDQIASPRTGRTNLFANRGLFPGSTRQADAKLLKDRHRESRTIGSVSQTGTAVYIRIANKLQSIGGNR